MSVTQDFKIEGQDAEPRYDHIFIATCILLAGVGLATLYSASYAYADRWFNGDKLHFVKRQFFLAVSGFLMFFVISRINTETIRRMIMPLVVIAIVLCIMPFIPGIGGEINGATRWIKIGSFSLQPSEFVKLILPMYLAHIFDKKQDLLDDFKRGVLPEVIITLIFFILIFLQNNFSTALFVAVNALAIFFLAGVRFRYFISAAIMLIPISALLIMTKEHRLLRIKSFINPELDPLGANYQVLKSIESIESGNFWGMGLGQGVHKISDILYVYSDLIFASLAEESGFIGVMLFALCFGVFAVRAYRIACRADSLFNKLLVCGLTTSIISQTLLNIAVTAGIMPVTGVPLPFFSAGGTSLVSTLTASGIIANVSRCRGKAENQNAINKEAYYEDT